MSPSTIGQIVTLVILLILSAFFSSAETALTTVSLHKMRAMAKKGNRSAKRVVYLREHQEKMLSAILIGNNIVNLSASSLTTTLAIHLSQHSGLGIAKSTFIGIATGVLTLAVLIFGEITPKTIASANSEKISLLYSSIVYVITFLLTPFIFFLNAFSSLLCCSFGISLHADRTMTEMELRSVVDVSQQDGVIEQGERKIIDNVVDFGDSVAKDIMCPRIDMAFASIDMTYQELVDTFLEEKYSRLPVYENTKDNVIGILYLKDLFFYVETHPHMTHFNLRTLLRKPLFTFEFQKTSVLMETMRKKSVSFAIVLDEYGSTAGLITLEDLLEEIVGDIRDEYDADEAEELIKLAPHEYLIEGSMKLDDINEKLGTHIESDDYDSIGGHMIELLDHLPEQGETVTEGDYLYSIKKLDNNRIEKVYLKVRNYPGEKDSE